VEGIAKLGVEPGGSCADTHKKIRMVAIWIPGMIASQPLITAAIKIGRSRFVVVVLQRNFLRVVDWEFHFLTWKGAGVLKYGTTEGGAPFARVPSAVLSSGQTRLPKLSVIASAWGRERHT
jgi:hypothetical protein